MNILEGIESAQTLAPGFEACGVASGIKLNKKLDCAIISSALPCRAAGVFTTNLVKAAPVLVSQQHLQTSNTFRGVIFTSGNANAATGENGIRAASALCEALASELGARTEQILIGQTGLIGKPFPTSIAQLGVTSAAKQRSSSGGKYAARAMMTTDTKEKVASVKVGQLTICGIAKGAAMLSPSLATMLALITTDIEASHAELQTVLNGAMESSFHSLVVDGCRSTNDTVLMLANGSSKVKLNKDLLPQFRKAVTAVCESLARQMAADAEGASKFMQITVRGAANVAEARLAAKAVAASALVKCSLAGENCYFGRILSELGASGAQFDPNKASIFYGNTCVCKDGVAHPYDESAMALYMKNRNIEISADLGAGTSEASAYGCDLTHGYVDENMAKS